MSIRNFISHTIIYFNSVESAKATGLVAMVKLCMGSDEDAIAQFYYRKDQTGNYAWTAPVLRKDNTDFPVFTGKVAEDLMGAVGKTHDLIKKAGIEGKIAGRVFRVAKNGKVEEIKQETAAK